MCSIRHTVPLATGTYECNGAVKNEDETRSCGYKMVTLQTLLASAGLLTQVLWQPSGFTRWLCAVPVRHTSLWRAGDLLVEDRGFLDMKEL